MRAKLIENINFERGIDPRDSLRIGKKWKWGMTGEELAQYILDIVGKRVKPILGKIEDAVLKAGHESMGAYYKYFYDYFDEYNEFPPDPKNLRNAKKELRKTIAEEVENFPTKNDDAKKRLIEDLFSVELEGGPFRTYVDIIKDRLDPGYLMK
jgi:uncharacterized protein Yka (UPF0111/DUF47 family)